MSALADTHLLLWHFEGKGRLSAQQQKAIASATPADPLLVADISLWEIASLVELGRVRLGIPLRDWLDRAMAPPLVRCIGISPAIAAEVASLPASFHRDPADRLIVATARVTGATLLTQDRRILDAGVVKTVG